MGKEQELQVTGEKRGVCISIMAPDGSGCFVYL